MQSCLTEETYLSCCCCCCWSLLFLKLQSCALCTASDRALVLVMSVDKYRRIETNAHKERTQIQCGVCAALIPLNLCVCVKPTDNEENTKITIITQIQMKIHKYRATMYTLVLCIARPPYFGVGQVNRRLLGSGTVRQSVALLANTNRSDNQTQHQLYVKGFFLKTNSKL